MLVSQTIHAQTSTATIVRIATGKTDAAVANVAQVCGLTTYYG
jgi:hypothetical protein